MTASKWWTKDFILIWIANFFAGLTFYILMTTLAVYAIEQFQASESMAGLTSSIFIIGSLLSRLATGKYVDVIGRKNLLYGSLAMSFLAILLYFPADALNLLLPVRFIHGIAFGVASTTMPTAVMALIPNERRGEGTSYYSLSMNTATAVGPFLGLFLLQHADYDTLFISCAAFSAASILIVLFANIPEANLTLEQRSSMKQGFHIKHFFEKNALPVCSIMIVMGTAYSGVLSFLSTYAFEIGLADAAGYFFLVYAISLFIARPIAGKLLDRKGDNVVIYPTILFFSFGMFALSGTESGFMLLFAAVLTAFGYGTLMPSIQAIAVKVTPKHRVGLSISTFLICLEAGTGFGPIFLGLLIPLTGFRGMYLTLAIIVMLSIGLYYAMHGKHAAEA